MIYPVKIVGVVVDVHNVTMYKADGDTIVIPQGDPRVRDLVAKLVPAFDTNGPQSYMLQVEDMVDRNHFADAEKKMGGMVRFFKMVKSKAKELLEKFVEPIEPMVLGTKEAIKSPPLPVHMVNGDVFEAPVVVEAKPKLPPEDERPLTKSALAVAEIMAQAVPSTNSNFAIPDAAGAEETTVIAVMDDDTIIPGCEALSSQAQAMSEGMGNSTGMEKFLRRAGMLKRGHSVEDLLKFIQKGELPLANDGCVLVYKLLKKTSVPGVFVDCHSGNVKQRVGSFVHMAESMVDPDRRQDCSNGLHVARRDYLRNFGGDVCVLAKLAPEDVIAVPQYDARKLRAKGYHIIAELSAADCQRVRSDKPMEDQVLLGNAIAGNHVGILEYVEITGSYGKGLVVTPVTDAVEDAPALDQSLSGSSLDHLPNAETNPEACKVDARALALETAKPSLVDDLPEPPAVAMPVEVPVQAAVVPNSTKRPVQVLVEAFQNGRSYATAKALLDYKKSCKKSWIALGVPASLVDELKGFEAASKVAITPLEPKQSTKDAIEKVLAADPVAALSKPAVKKASSKKAAKPQAPAPKVADPKPKAAKPAAATGVKKMTQQEEMAKLVGLYEKNPDKMNARAIYNFKQKAKKGWDVLGVTDAKFIKKITERAKL